MKLKLAIITQDKDTFRQAVRILVYAMGLGETSWRRAFTQAETEKYHFIGVFVGDTIDSVAGYELDGYFVDGEHIGVLDADQLAHIVMHRMREPVGLATTFRIVV